MDEAFMLVKGKRLLFCEEAIDLKLGRRAAYDIAVFCGVGVGMALYLLVRWTSIFALVLLAPLKYENVKNSSSENEEEDRLENRL